MNNVAIIFEFLADKLSLSKTFGKLTVTIGPTTLAGLVFNQPWIDTIQKNQIVIRRLFFKKMIL